jgi:hypothetical protein
VGLKVTNANGEDTIGYNDLIEVLGSSSSYCLATTTCDEYISRVKLNTIDNSSSCGAYQDFTSISTDLGDQMSYEIVITNGNFYEGDIISCWVDWNQDFDFDDEKEKITIKYYWTEEGNGTVTVPYGALLGETRMRVRIQYGEAPEACGAGDFGEVEDYTINVVESEKFEVILKVKDEEDNNIEGARTSINLDHLKYTNNEGETFYYLVPGKYLYIVNASGFFQMIEEIEVEEKDSTYQIVLLSTSIEDQVSNSNEFSIYPNPTSGIVTIQGEELTKSKITVYDIVGKKILNRVSENTELSIDISEFSNGIYIIQIDTGEKVYKQKLIKE